MARRTRGTYYLGRVVKLGDLDDSRIAEAILEPKPILRGKSAWTFVDGQRIGDNQSQFIFARLIKYAPNAEVKVVDPARRAEVLRDEPNLSVADSPFVYIPAYSGIAFLQVSQHIEQHVFASRFADLLKAAYDGFFVECSIEFVSDLRTFAAKLARLQAISKLTATLYPPNPIFGPLWRGLKEYMEDRRVDTLNHEEEAKGESSINTELPRHVAAIASQSETAPYQPKKPLPIGDAAILMAADGYGHGLVHGNEGENAVVIRTAETVRNFSFDRDPEPQRLYEEAVELFEEIQRQRHMEH